MHCSEVFLAIATPQFTVLVQFYHDLLQQSPAQMIPDVYAEFCWPGMKLGIFDPHAEHREVFTAGGGGAMSLCLEVTNLEEAIAHLTALGYPPPGPIITASHGREVYAYDPDGNRLILHQRP